MSFCGEIVKFIDYLARRPNNTIKNSGHDVNLTNNTYNDTQIIKWIIMGGVFIIVALIILIFTLSVGTPKNKDENVVISKTNITSHSAKIISPNTYTTENHVNMLINNAHIDVSRIPDGYFIALQRIKPVIEFVANQGFATIAWVRPDISVGNSFRAYMKDKNPELYEKRIDCTYLYTDEQVKRVPIRCYSMEMVDEFDSFLVNEYIPNKQWRYIYRINKKVQSAAGNTYNIYVVEQ